MKREREREGKEIEGEKDLISKPRKTVVHFFVGVHNICKEPGFAVSLFGLTLVLGDGIFVNIALHKLQLLSETKTLQLLIALSPSGRECYHSK